MTNEIKEIIIEAVLNTQSKILINNGCIKNERTDKTSKEAKEPVIIELVIIDLNGKRIEITDIDKAIAQADNFRHMTHTDPQYKELDKELNTYWEDIYTKLIARKEENNE